MSTDELIGRLVSDARPVRQSPRPLALFARWSAIGSLYLAAGVLLIGTRDDLAAMWQEFDFVFHTLIVLAVMVLAAGAAFLLSIPGREIRFATWSSATALAIWLAWMLVEIATAAGPLAGIGWKCLRNLVVLGVPPGILMYRMVARAAPLRIGVVGWLCALGAAAAADLATRFICRNDQALHALVWHFLPVLALGCIGFLLGRILFRWDSARRQNRDATRARFSSHD